MCRVSLPSISPHHYNCLPSRTQAPTRVQVGVTGCSVAIGVAVRGSCRFRLSIGEKPPKP